jgi:hypothetical protein
VSSPYYPAGTRVFFRDDPYRLGTARPADWNGYYYVDWDTGPDDLHPYNGNDLIRAGRIGEEDTHAT